MLFVQAYGLTAVLSKYFRVLSDIGLTEFQILSNRTKFCRTNFYIKPIVNYVELFGAILNHLKKKIILYLKLTVLRVPKKAVR